jgi:hypothetical protein
MLMALNWMSTEASSPLFALRSVICKPTWSCFAKRNWILLSKLSVTSFPHNSSAASGIIILLCLLVPSRLKVIINLEELCPFVSTITLANSLLGFRIRRWSTLYLIGRNKRMVHFITVYQVVAKESSGLYTAFQQQLQCLRLADRELPPQRVFLIDLEKYIRSLQTPLSQFVVMGDFNEVVGTSMSRFAKVTSEF